MIIDEKVLFEIAERYGLEITKATDGNGGLFIGNDKVRIERDLVSIFTEALQYDSCVNYEFDFSGLDGYPEQALCANMIAA